jgi:thiamine transport system permease protein
VLAVFFVLPFAGMVGKGLVADGGIDLAGVGEILGADRLHRVVGFTLWSSGLATLVALVAGLPLAFVTHRVRFPGRSALRVMVAVPFVLPTIVVAVAFRTLLAPTGPLGFLRADGTPWAIVAALAFFNIGVVSRTVGNAWDALDVRQAEAAAALGASPFRVLTKVTLPALGPSLISGATVVFLFCSTSFGVVLAMGGLKYSTLESEIYLQTVQLLDLRTAAVLSLLQFVLVVMLLGAAARARRRSVDIGGRADPRRLRGSDTPALALAAVGLALIVVPIANLVIRSVRLDGEWTVSGYRALANGDLDVLGALRHSLAIAVDATLLSMFLGILVALVVTRRPSGPGERRVLGLLEGAFMLPLGVSAVTLGFGFLITLNHPPIDLRSSPVIIPIAQALVALPIVVRLVVPALHAVDDRQRQAAAAMGAGPVRVVWSIDLPLIWRPLLAATGFAFAVSMGEFGATSFLVRPDQPTLPVIVYQSLSHPGALSAGSAWAASVLLGGVTALIMVAVEAVRGEVKGTTW